jgi:hypothetical protein
VNEKDVLFLVESLCRRANDLREELPRTLWAEYCVRNEVLWLADLTQKWLDPGRELQYELLMVRSLALVRRPREALLRLRDTLKKPLAHAQNGEILWPTFA